MALDSTVAGANADSYLSVADANTLAAADLGSEAAEWAASADTARKEQALKRATREIDKYLRSGWTRYSPTQRLLFPRAVDYNGTPAVPFIQQDIRLATYEQATYLFANADAIDAAGIRWARANQGEVASNEQESGDYLVSPAAKAYLDGFRRGASGRGIRSVRVSGYAP